MIDNRLQELLQQHPSLTKDLELVRQLRLPDWCIAAGYVRNYVWDCLHGYDEETPLNDVDVLYYDPEDLREETEKQWERQLRQLAPTYPWSVKNQARMHLRNQEPPYMTMADAMMRWPETATAIGVYSQPDGRIGVIAPHGSDDLLGLIVRQSPYFQDTSKFLKRVHSKKWLERWPKLKLIE
ncbi:nucleotidyltransferase family protein [Paenibacillus cymbidii]|uniref:nucleotidyltransferase family protein n=1 Tax=Paenibacillus cymbidii TaxID=1639034 RepID=UPI00108208DF|nr:nucleotidyltransferase family protein [Paenibacillus cymbidii]